MKKSILSFITLLVLFTGQLLASGFQINEHGARAMGLGNAFTGLADDPSAVYFNSAGITQLYGTQFSFGATYINPKSTFTGPAPSITESKLKNQFFTPYNFYFTQSLGSDLWVGFGANNPFGLGTEWEGDWVGRYRTTKTEIRTFNFSPVIAYQITEQFSASIGFTYSYSDVLIARKIPVVVPGVGAFPDATIEMEGDGSSFGYNAALFYKATKELSLGISFHSQIKYDYEGDAVVTLSSAVPGPIQTAVLAQMPKGKIKAPMTTPMVLAFGAAYRAMDNWVVTADFQYNGWSSYDKLEVTFEDFRPGGAPLVSTSKRDYKNSFIVRAGSEYVLNNGLALRGGVFYDVNPIKDERLDPVLPDANRIGLNIGLGYKIFENLSVEASYLHLIFEERTITNSEEVLIPIAGAPVTLLNGTYNSNANLIALGFSYSF